MSAVTIEPTGNPVFPWMISSPCQTWAEAMAKAREIAAISPDAFIPVEPAHHAVEAPMPEFLGEQALPSIPLPEIPEPLARDADDDMGLKAGEAIRPVNQIDEE